MNKFKMMGFDIRLTRDDEYYNVAIKKDGETEYIDVDYSEMKGIIDIYNTIVRIKNREEGKWLD